MSGKVTLFISGISGSKEVFFAEFNVFLQIALGVDLNNVLIYKTVDCKPGCKWSLIQHKSREILDRNKVYSGISTASYTVSLMIKLLYLSNNR